MRPQYRPWLAAVALFISLSFAARSGLAQQFSPGTIPVSTVVTVEARHGKNVPTVKREDVRVYQGKDRNQVTDWIPLQDNQAGLELFILIEETTDASVASQFDDLRRFLNSQPPTTAVAVGYLQNGSVQLVQNFTKDHAAAEGFADSDGRVGWRNKPISGGHRCDQALAGKPQSPRGSRHFGRHRSHAARIFRFLS